jgi:hypothetical protein
VALLIPKVEGDIRLVLGTLPHGMAFGELAL